MISESAIIKLQASWRGRRLRHSTILRCPTCDDFTIIPRRADSIWTLFKFPTNLETGECDTCFEKTRAAASPVEADDSLFGSNHGCGDWLCPGDCGVLLCGCIDVCRKRHGCYM